MYFRYFTIISQLKKAWSYKLAKKFWRRFFLNFVNVFSLFRD